MRRWLIFLVLVALASPTAASGQSTEDDPSAAARQKLIALLENVHAADPVRYQLRDSTGLTMDTLKVIQLSEGGYLAIYHVNQGERFSVRIADSTDGIEWRYRRTLDQIGPLDGGASHPTITRLPDDSFLVAYEKFAPGAQSSQLRLRWYTSLDLLLANLPAAERTLLRSLSDRHEGTPSIRSVRWGGNPLASTIELGFHFYDDRSGREHPADRNARGTLRNFALWTAEPAEELNAPLSDHHHVGDREDLVFEGHPFTLIEGQQQRDDWSTWRSYLYDETAGTMTPLNVRTHGGSPSIASPTATVVKDPSGYRALAVSFYIHAPGAAPGEAGPVLLYQRF